MAISFTVFVLGTLPAGAFMVVWVVAVVDSSSRNVVDCLLLTQLTMFLSRSVIVVLGTRYDYNGCYYLTKMSNIHLKKIFYVVFVDPKLQNFCFRWMDILTCTNSIAMLNFLTLASYGIMANSR